MTDKPAILHAPRTSRLPLNNRRRTIAACIAAAIALAAVLAAGFALYAAAQHTDLTLRALPPTATHPFGTDMLGRDMLQRTLAGLATSIIIGLLAATISSVIALAAGLAAALGPRRLDGAINWLIDLMLGIPHIILLLLISVALGGGALGIVTGIALTHWPALARVIRAEVLQIRNSGYVAVARQLGLGPLRIAREHMLPHVLPQYLTGLILLFPHAILHEAALTFLGFGLPNTQPAIGVILSESMTYLTTGAWWLALFPGLALVAVVLLFDRLGTGLRTILDPHRSQE